MDCEIRDLNTLCAGDVFLRVLSTDTGGRVTQNYVLIYFCERERATYKYDDRVV